MESEVADAVVAAVQHFGKVTGLVTCAGTVGVSNPVEDLDVGAALKDSVQPALCIASATCLHRCTPEHCLPIVSP